MLLAAHQEPQRHYHDLTHLAECFALVDAMGDLTTDERAATELTIWFHDAVYDPTASDNEERSAKLAGEFLHEAGLDPMRALVVRAIESTAGHDAGVSNPVLCAVHDADLAVLGASQARYDRYAADIRKEYAHVPDTDFAAGRSAVLRSFLEAAPLYLRPDTVAQRDAQARRNLDRELTSLKSNIG